MKHKKPVFKITGANEGTKCKIYINGYLHCMFYSDLFKGLSSWIEHAESYRIELSFTKGSPIVLQYSTQFKWLAMLDFLNKLL